MNTTNVFQNVKHGQDNGSLVVTPDSIIFQSTAGDHSWSIRESVKAQTNKSTSAKAMLRLVQSDNDDQKFTFQNREALEKAANDVNKNIKDLTEPTSDDDEEFEDIGV